MKKNTIIFGDCIEELKNIDDDSIDLIFADPPYNLQLSEILIRPNGTVVDGVKEDWDNFSSFEEYDIFTKNWLSECKRILKKTGSFWISGSYHNIFRIGTILQNLNFWILNDIIWIKNNPMPNFLGKRFTNATETLIWCKKDKDSKITFNYKVMKQLNDNKQMRNDWYFPICSGKERIKNENGKKAHPTQKPLALIERIILSSSNINDLILDPFGGTGTTAIAALKLKRNFIIIEKDKSYISIIENRLSENDYHEIYDN
jgi:DNA modification methylase